MVLYKITFLNKMLHEKPDAFGIWKFTFQEDLFMRGFVFFNQLLGGLTASVMTPAGRLNKIIDGVFE